MREQLTLSASGFFGIIRLADAILAMIIDTVVQGVRSFRPS